MIKKIDHQREAYNNLKHAIFVREMKKVGDAVAPYEDVMALFDIQKRLQPGKLVTEELRDDFKKLVTSMACRLAAKTL